MSAQRPQPLKWFFALNQSSAQFEQYAEMIKVAVHIASKHTSLVPHFIYDGEENSLTSWLRGRGVTVVHRRSFLYEGLREIAERRNDPNVLTTGSGAFLRTELPGLARDLGLADEYVLYTDCDVMFVGEVCDYLGQLRPRYFTVGPESNSRDYNVMNSGVMLMNLPNMAATDQQFRGFMRAELESLTRSTWDQEAYIRFYGRRLTGRQTWDRLPIEYNWKPYWGTSPSAKIVHFHGPKPHQRELIRSGRAPRILMLLSGGAYLELCGRWDEMLAEAAAHTPDGAA
jgi:hypothetical protein